MRKRFWVYKITNIVTGKYYIGQTNDINKRISAHRLAKDKGMYISASVAKYGWNSHTVEILFEDKDVSIDLANQIEVYYIRFYGGCYPINELSMNLNEGGMQGIQTKEQLDKMLISKFESWKKKMGKDGLGIEVYTKEGVYLFVHYGTSSELYKKLDVNSHVHPSQVITNSLREGKGLVYGKYLIQFEGENRVEKYFLDKQKRIDLLKKAPMTEKRLKSLRPNTSREWIKKKIVDIYTGEIAFCSISDFAMHERISTTAVMKRFRTNKYSGVYEIKNPS